MSEEAAATQNATEENDGGIQFVYDVPVKLSVVLGSATLSIGDILKCGKGSVIPLDQKLGDPFKVMLEDRLLAEGEVVETGDNLGIKITNIFKTGEDSQSN